MKPTIRSRFARMAAGVAVALGLSTPAFAQDALPKAPPPPDVVPNSPLPKSALEPLATPAQNLPAAAQDTPLNPQLAPQIAPQFAPQVAPPAVPQAAPISDAATRKLMDRMLRLEKQNEDLRKNAEAQQKANENLLKMLQTQPTSVPAAAPGLAADDVRNIVSGYLQEKEAKAAAAAPAVADPNAPFKVGSDMRITPRWNQYGIVFETPHKDFAMHLGGWFQYDTVWWNQSRNMTKQVGDFEDGNFFRRIRLQADGTVWQIGEYNMIFGFENTQKSTIALFEMWAGVKDLPGIGMLRIGRMVTPQGLEGDDTTTNKAMTFLERSSMSDAFYQNFSSGLWQGNSIFDQRFCYQSMIYKTDVAGNTGASFGDGEYCATGRLCGLPIYQQDGRYLMHLGGSATWRHATRGGNETADPQFVRFRARPEQRDFTGDIDGTVHDGAINPGDGNRLVDTGNIQCTSASIWGTEFLAIFGPLSIQAEYAWTVANDPYIGGKHYDSAVFDGGYIQVSYFLTGEHRTYDKRLGRLAPTYFAGPSTPFWFVRGADGLSVGPGAWEVAARYSHLNLNSSRSPINGGVMDGLTFGINWYLNQNIKIQFQYVHDNRFDLATGQIPGYVDGLGIRAQFTF